MEVIRFNRKDTPAPLRFVPLKRQSKAKGVMRGIPAIKVSISEQIIVPA